jgi:flagellar hook-length control protein FliK
MPQPVALQITPPKDRLPPTNRSPANRLLEPKAELLRTSEAQSAHGVRFRDALKHIERKQTEARAAQHDGEPEKPAQPEKAGKAECKTTRTVKGHRRDETAKSKRETPADESTPPATETSEVELTDQRQEVEDAEATNDDAGEPASESAERASDIRTDCNNAVAGALNGPAPKVETDCLNAEVRPKDTQVDQAGAASRSTSESAQAPVEAIADPGEELDPSANIRHGAPGDAQHATPSLAGDDAEALSGNQPSHARGSGSVSRPALGGELKAPDEPASNAAPAGHEAAPAPAAPSPSAASFEQFLEHLITPKQVEHTDHDEPESANLAGGAPSAELLGPGAGAARETSATQLPAARAATELPPETRFAADNHEKIVSGVRGELLPNGGTMKLRLDPPELGTLQVSLHLRDGVVTAAFQTANDDAARMLSHTLGDLRATLEAHGIAVDKLHVQQSPRDEGGDPSTSDDAGRNSQTFEQQQESRREQQRRDAVQRIWDKLAGIAPIDLVA